MAVDPNDFRPGDSDNNLLRKILARLEDVVTAITGSGGGGGPATDVNATLTLSDIQIGAVEIKDATSDTRVVVVGAAPGAGDNGLVVRNIPSGTQAISAATLPLPTGAATEATLATRNAEATQLLIKAKTDNLDVALSTRNLEATQLLIKAKTDNLDVALSTRASDRTTAAAPFSFNLSDGAAFYTAAKTGQFPAALVGGRLDANVGAWLGSTAPTVGSKTSANSIPVVIASDQAAVPISGAITNAGTFAVQDSQVIADNAAFTDGTSKLFMGGFIFDEVAGTALTENDAAAARVDSKRAVVGVIEDATTRGQRAAVTAANALKVDGSAVTQPVNPTGETAGVGIGAATDAASAGDGSVIAILKNIRGLFATQQDKSSFIEGTGPTTVISGLFDDVGVASLSEDTIGAVRITNKRAMHVHLRDNSGTALASSTFYPLVGGTALVVRPTGLGADLLVSAPTFATVGVASASAVAANANRTGLILTNTSNNTISLGIGAAAVLNSGITLFSGDSYQMDMGNFSSLVVNAIASSASSNLAIQEFTG